ncbi:MAG: hypothetical protein P9X24_01040 [Candidatus Hatepunaea meridiana]|nr:hypothetical protein [Candidatus Hatepunaea meridiana]
MMLKTLVTMAQVLELSVEPPRLIPKEALDEFGLEVIHKDNDDKVGEFLKDKLSDV